MIFESWYWKRELVELVSDFDTWGPRHIQDFDESFWHGESGFKIERALFHSAMAVRRLIDSNKITDTLRGKSLAVESARSKEQGPHTVRSILGSVDVLKWFEMDNPEKLNISPYNMASEIVHSFTLELIANDDETDIDSILVASERNQFVRAIVISKSVWVGLLRLIVQDRVQGMRVLAGSEGKDPSISIF